MMGADPVTLGLLATAAAGTVHQVESAKSARFKQEGVAGRAQAQRTQAAGRKKEKGKQEEFRKQQQLQRQKQQAALSSGAAGRKGTILGGKSAGNTGGQTAGSGKTLLGA
jgi:hypothetical protein